MTDQAISTEKFLLPRQILNLIRARDLIITGFIGVVLILFLTKAGEFNLLGNLQILSMWMATIGIVAVGQTWVVLTGGIDLSVGSIVAFSSVLTASLVVAGWNPVLALILSLAASALIGWLHGVLITQFGLAPFVVTFGSLSLVRGLAQVISGAAPINVSSFRWVWVNVFGLIPLPVLVMLVIFVLTSFMLRRTRLGRYAYAIGNSESVARLSGINVNRTRQIIYAISGFMAGLAGFLIMARIEGGIYTNGQDYELVSIAAVIIGGTSLRGGKGGIWGTFAGVLLIAMINNGLILFNAPPLWRDVITGAIIIGAALIDRQRRKLQEGVILPMNNNPGAPPFVIKATDPLEQTLMSFAAMIKERFSVAAVSVYLCDAQSKKLIDPLKKTDAGSWVLQAAQQVAPSVITDFQTSTAVQPIHPEMRSALAIPIKTQGRLVGVIEFQAAVVNAFPPPTLRTLTSVCAQQTAILEARWLLESGWLAQQVRESLRNIHDTRYLDQSPLGDWLAVLPDDRGSSLRHLLLDVIENLCAKSTDAQSRANRRYKIIKQTYLDQKGVDAVIHDLGLSRRQYFYDLKEAIDTIAHDIFTQSQSLATFAPIDYTS
jgi:ribose/xylose/arabinose/galactoside ABC-type transport system permease subunit